MMSRVFVLHTSEADDPSQYMSVMNIAPGKPAEVNIAGLLAEHAGEIEQGLKQNLPKMF